MPRQSNLIAFWRPHKSVCVLANAVRVTLRPKGRNVVLDKSFGAPRITNAASIAGLLITTEAMVAELPTPPPPTTRPPSRRHGVLSRSRCEHGCSRSSHIRLSPSAGLMSSRADSRGGRASMVVESTHGEISACRILSGSALGLLPSKAERGRISRWRRIGHSALRAEPS
jgi:hypothetical protein